jgi:hypothetical protein
MGCRNDLKTAYRPRASLFQYSINRSATGTKVDRAVAGCILLHA